MATETRYVRSKRTFATSELSRSQHETVIVGTMSKPAHEWLAMALAGDEAAWEQVVKVVAGLVFGVSRDYQNHNDEDAKDLAAEIILKFLEKKFANSMADREFSLESWIVTVANHAIISRNRRPTTRKRSLASVEDLPLEAKEQRSPADSLIDKEERERLERCKAALDPREREVLALLNSGSTLAEIAKSWEWSLKAVWKLKHLAIDKLIRCIHKRMNR